VSTYFVGEYTQRIRVACVSAALSNEHALLIGPPGTGKTEMGLDIIKRVTDDQYAWMSANMGTPTSKITGRDDLAAAFKGEWKVILDDTPYDPNMRGVLIDEVGRANDPFWSALIDALERKDIPPDEAPFFLFTTNFMPRGEKYAALVDRIPHFVHVNPRVDVAEVARSALACLGGRPTVAGDVPTWQEVLEVRSARPDERTINSVVELVTDISDAIKNYVAREQSEFVFNENQRTIRQWAKIIYRMSVWITGEEHFGNVPDDALNVIQWLYPTADYQQHLEWQNVISEVVDTAQSSIRQVLVDFWFMLQTARQAIQDRIDAGEDPYQVKQDTRNIYGNLLQDCQNNLHRISDKYDITDAMIIAGSMVTAATRGDNAINIPGIPDDVLNAIQRH